MKKGDNSIIFEISWEAANKVGGIFTVITSKYPYSKNLSDKYYFIGPYFRENYNIDFIEQDLPEEFREIYNTLKNKNIILHYGIWKTLNAPIFLIDSTELMSEKKIIKTKLWEDFKIDSLFSGYDFEEPVVWSYAVGIFLEEFYNKNKGNKIIAQFHEWLTGAGILYLKRSDSKVATIFTTHATVLERAMASTKESLYKRINPEEEAKKRGVIDKHTLEKQSAINADIFTTVSDICSYGCKIVLGREPDFITINGLDIDPLNKESINKNKSNRIRIINLAKSVLLAHYDMDFENAFYCFISGRMETYSKGIDVFIKSLGKLNRIKLKRDIIAFILIPASHGNGNPIILNNFNNLNNSIKGFLSRPGDFPQISTHYDSDNYIINSLINEGLNNNYENKVKVIFCPLYLSKDDNFFNKDYYDSIKGFDLGVFPSFYEPWGYTPAECAALGIPAITSDKAGFGIYYKNSKIKKKNGIYVLNRVSKSDSEFIKTLSNKILTVSQFKNNEELMHKIAAAEFSKTLSWKYLIKNYKNAYQKAIKKVY